MGGRVWLQGGNPYDPQHVHAEWIRLGGRPEKSPGARGRLAMVYPLGAYVVAAGVGALPVDLWRPVWNLLNIGLYLATIAMVLAIARIRCLTAAGLAFVGGALVMAPSHTNIAVGQTGVLVCFAIVLAQFLQQRGATGASGIASGVALTLKPQTALAFFLHDLLRARWRTVLVACLTAGALMGVGL